MNDTWRATISTVNLTLTIDRETGMFHFDVLGVNDTTGNGLPVAAGREALDDALTAYAAHVAAEGAYNIKRAQRKGKRMVVQP